MAVITTSGSMPFSFASASIVCISGFAMFVPGPHPPVFQCRAGAASLEFHFEIRARDDVHRHPMAPAIVAIHQDESAFVVDAAEASLEMRLAVHGFTHHHLGPAAGK